MDETGYAKINLALHVRAREADGYHRIETLFAFCEDGDRLSVGHGEGLSLCVTGAFADGLSAGEDNLVLRAARALGERCGRNDGALTLEKRLPVASGIGGGSADAAAALRLLCRWWGLGLRQAELLKIASSLGADVPACLLSETTRGEGRGDRLHALDLDLTGTPVLLVNPRTPLSTAAVFRAWDGIDRGPLPHPYASPHPFASSEVEKPLRKGRSGRDGVSTSLDTNGFEASRNDLEASAISIVPEIAEVLAALAGASLARMSGSGATCFGLYASEGERDAAAERIAAKHPDWWILPTRLR